MNIVFRTDASPKIGTGHVVRCLTLANALSGGGAECRFVCREDRGNLIELIREDGFEVQGLPKEADDWRSDAEATQKTLANSCIDWLIVDHYALDARWESALRPHCKKIMVIDDLADRQHDCDLLLDQNVVANMEHRYEGKLSLSCGKMLGPHYALLQSQYADFHSLTRPREGAVQRILIYFGGADVGNLTAMAISAFLSLQRDDIHLDVVLSSEGPQGDSIRRQIEGKKHITLHERLPGLGPLMADADLAIGAGGTTTWERCCLGLPTLVITLAENQKPIAAELDRRGLIRWLGDQDEVSEDDLALELREVADAGLAPGWSEDCQRLVDGKGAQRVTRVLLLDANTPLKARLAKMDDEALILEWANDPLVRQNAFDTDLIDPEIHRAWFCTRLGSPDECHLYIVETDDGLPVGQVRFERSGDSWEIHYGLDGRFRGRGVAVSFLRAALNAAEVNSKSILCRLFGRVKPENIPSQKVFRRLGFAEECAGDELMYRFNDE